MDGRREKFGGRMAYIAAVAGSAIGLGNIWRFPYVLGEYGGAAFIIIYILCGLLLVLPVFFSEAVIGRRGRGSAFRALESLAPGSGWKGLGFLTILSCFVIVSYYSVVGGWSADYLVRACAGRLSASSQEAATSLFSGVSSGIVEPLVSFTVFLGVTALIVSLGIRKGIETFSKFTLPVLFVLIVILAIFSLSLPGAEKGVSYLVRPDFSKITASTVAFALGQSFFSMSLGVGTVLVYSSFMDKGESILSSGGWTFVFDTLFAILAAFAVIPAVFAAGLEPGTGPALVFETLPYIFTKMGASIPVLGGIVPVLFFLAILMAALTSSISVFEVIVEYAIERFGCSRRKASVILLASSWLLGALCALSFGPLAGLQLFDSNIFGFCDMLTSNFFMMVGALSFSLFVGWRMKEEDFRDEFTNGGTLAFGARIFRGLRFMLRWVVPAAIAVIFITNIIL